jgi:hypothetical protein
MKSKQERMAEIRFWAIPPEGTKDYDRLIKELKKRESPEVNKKVKKIFKKAAALMEVQQVNGLGFSADTMLREYNREYNSRVFNGSLHDLPGSFNVVEAFNEFIPPSATFKIRDEIDHIFSFDEFIDFVTSDELDSSDMPSLEHAIDGKIYSYNSACDPREITFSTKNDKTYGFSSISFIKFNNEVSIIIVAGQECDLSSKTEEIKESLRNQKVFSHRSHIQPSEDFKVGAMPLSESCPLLKSIVLARIDLERQTFDARYVYEDWGQSYRRVTDDVSAFIDTSGNFIDRDTEEYVKKMPEVMNQYQALFELCKTCLFLPDYFDTFSEDVRIERHPTDFIKFRNKKKNKKSISLVGSVYKIPYRQPAVLFREFRRSPARAVFSTPDIKIETNGFWKQLPIESQGKDKNGNQITGRTWVSKTLSWSEDPVGDRKIAISRNRQSAPTDNAGFIYVMRSGAHQKDVFKVGLTRRDPETRSKELSASTSSPDYFLVVEEWFVKDCVLAEKLIHQKLDSYRVNPKREYFKARYSVIFSVIDEIISEIENS